MCQWWINHMMQKVCKTFTVRLCGILYCSKKLHNIGFNIIYTISGKQTLDAKITKKRHDSSVSSWWGEPIPFELSHTWSQGF
jgi:hypothetical protein